MEGVIHKEIKPVHEDERRVLVEIMSGIFEARQIKLLYIKKDSILGNHYHPYRQFFYMFEGSSIYLFENIDTKERMEIKVKKGDFILIEKRIAHKAIMKEWSISIEGNEQPYTSPEVDDLKYVIK